MMPMSPEEVAKAVFKERKCRNVIMYDVVAGSSKLSLLPPPLL